MINLALDEKYQKATEIICKQGIFPFPLSKTAITIIKRVVQEEVLLDLICAFEKAPSQTMDQLKQTIAWTEAEILQHTDSLAKAGLLFNQPSSKGIMV